MQSLTREMIVVMLFHVVAVLLVEMCFGRQLVGGVRKGRWPRSGVCGDQELLEQYSLNTAEELE